MNFDVVKSEAIQDKGNKRLLEDKPDGIINTVNFKKEGIITQVLPDQSAKVLVNMDQLLDYLIQTDP